MVDKTADLHRHNFRSLTLLKKPFRRMSVFSREKSYLQQLLIIFPNLKFFLYLQIILNAGGEKKHFNDTKTFHTGSTANLPAFAISKNSNFFPKRTEISYILRNFSLSVAFYGKFGKRLWWTKFHFQNRRTSDAFSHRTLFIIMW